MPGSEKGLILGEEDLSPGEAEAKAGILGQMRLCPIKSADLLRFHNGQIAVFGAQGQARKSRFIVGCALHERELERFSPRR